MKIEVVEHSQREEARRHLESISGQQVKRTLVSQEKMRRVSANCLTERGEGREIGLSIEVVNPAPTLLRRAVGTNFAGRKSDEPSHSFWSLKVSKCNNHRV